MGAIIFVPVLAACVIFGFVFALFFANRYLNVLQSTGSGARQVEWPSEPMVDNFWKVFYLGWLIGLWLGPALFVGRAFAASVDQPWMKYAVPLSVFWICYPVSQLSSLSGPSIWLPLHYDVFGRLARKPHIVVSFLALSGLVLIAFGIGLHLTFFASGLQWLLIGSPLFVVAALLYARLLGRLAFVLRYTRSILARKKKKKPRARATPEPSNSEPRFAGEPPRTDVEEEAAGFLQPSELPPIQTPDEGPMSGYDVKFDDDHPRPRKRVRAESAEPSSKNSEPAPEPANAFARPSPENDDEALSYGVRKPEVELEEKAPVNVVKPSELELKLIGREGAPKPPKQAWNAEVFEFLVQPGTLVVTGLLTTMCILVGGLVRLAREFNPISEGS